MTANRKKTCTGCRATKALDAFYRHPSGKDGRAPKCKVCTRASVKANREQKADYYREKYRERYSTNPEWRATKTAYYRAYIKTERGRESRRVTQRAYRAYRKAVGAPPFPSERPEAKAVRYARHAARQQQLQVAA